MATLTDVYPKTELDIHPFSSEDPVLIHSKKTSLCSWSSIVKPGSGLHGR